MNLGSAEYNRLYLPEEKKYSENKAENINPKNDNNALAFVVNAVTENSAVLDVGCAYGYIGEWLKKNKNCSMYGLDVDFEALNYVKKTGYYKDLFNIDLNLDFTSFSAPSTSKKDTERFNSLSGDTFDFIICADVLEHLKDPTGALEILASKLKFSGQFVISVPNIAHLDIILNLLDGKFNYSDFGLLDNTHLRFFTKRSFIEWVNLANEKFKKNGFKFDIELFGKTRYSSEFLEDIKIKYPNIFEFFIEKNDDLLILQNIIILTKVNSHANLLGMSKLLKNFEEYENNSESGILKKISGELEDYKYVKSELENTRIRFEETLSHLNEIREKNLVLRRSLNAANDEKNEYLLRLQEISKSDFWKAANFYYKLRDKTFLKYAFKFLKKVKHNVRYFKNPVKFTKSIFTKNENTVKNDINAAFLKKIEKSNRRSGNNTDGKIYKNRGSWYSGDNPAVSIIILNYNKSKITVQCIKEIWKHTEGVKYEIIVVDNGSERGDKKYLKQLEESEPLYFTLLELSRNRFFGEGNNIGSEKAKGVHLLFLNNDAFVTSGWLTPLVSALSDENTAAAGPMFLYPDGRLQEAGAFIKEDGSALQRGKLDDPKKREYNETLEVDYCSAACLIVKRALFEEVLGFDLCWEPAYYEDVDLCFKFKLAGKKTLYIPSSKVVHLENLTSSDDKFPLKLNNIVEINKEKFIRKYKNILIKKYTINKQ
ncbi:MAG: methyltransferase domain-containing protein [Deltaproteobacteria bacterium]|nr:methyltransferase domain-containing protein [Deltaproteobacteria bacterium]